MGEMPPKENPRLSSEELQEIIVEVTQEELKNAEPIGEVELDPRVARMRDTVMELAQLDRVNRDQANEAQ